MSRAPGRRLVGSLAALAILVVVVPAALVAVAQSQFGGAHPLAGVEAPWRWFGDEPSRAITEPIADSTLIDALVRACLCAAWLAVVVLLVTTVVEAVHLVRHGGIPHPRVRGLGWAQHVGRMIAAGLVVALPLASTSASIADSLRPNGLTGALGGVESPAVTAMVADVTSPAAGDEHVRHTVREGESVYSIAERLGAAVGAPTIEVADAIVDTNLGRSMGPGERFTNPAYLQVGWVLDIPARYAAPGAVTPPGRTADPPAGIHVVERGDTLWDIAAERLGDPSGWPAIWQRNAGRDMGDGRTFDDPHLILPGWVLHLDGVDAGPAADEPSAVPELDAIGEDDIDEDPIDEDAIDEDTIGAPQPSEPRRDVDGPVADVRDHPITVDPVADPPIRFDDMVPPAAASGRIPDDRSPTERVGDSVPPAPGAAEPAADPPSRDDAPGAPSPIRLEHAALLAAGVLALVGVRRRQRLRASRPRLRVPAPRPDAVETERRLRAVDAGERSLRVDVATRAIGHAIRDTEAQIAWMESSIDGDVEVHLTGEAALDPPWRGAGRRWRLPADVPIELLSEAACQVDMPCMTLVQVGVTASGGEVLVDLEACGSMAVEASPEQGDEVVVAIAAGLASSLYAEVAHLIGVSVPGPAMLGHRNAHTVESPDAALDLAASLVGSTVSAGCSTFTLRCLRTGGEMWEPAVVLLLSADTDAGQLAIPDGSPDPLCPTPGRGLAVVAAVPPGGLRGAGARIVGDAHGWRLEAFGAGIDLTPVGLGAADLAGIDAVMEDAQRPLESMELAAADELRWDVAGTEGDVQPATTLGGPSGSEQTPPAGQTSGVDDGRAELPYEEPPHDIVVGLLGGVVISDRSGTAAQFERSKTVELIAWLATHRDGSTRTGARTALWEMDVRDATFANVVSEARRGLARLVAPPDGEEWVARTLNERLPLHRRVVTDAELVEARIEHARLQPPRAAIDTLCPAVTLIRGMPFADTSYLWPDAEGITSNLVLVAMTAATEFAGHALSLGDTEGVFWSTAQGLKVLAGHEELIALRMRAHARAGDLAGVRQEWESYERVLVADPWSDGEPAPKLVALRHELLA